MKKHLWITVIVAFASIVGYFLYRSNAIAQREHYIFCETLTPGMGQEDILDSLRKFGEIDYSTPPSFGRIAVGYVDPQIVGQRTYILSFRNGKYSGVSVIPSFWEGKGIGTVNTVCEP